MLKNHVKISGSGSGGGWLSKFNQFFLVHRHICWKKFREDPSSSFYVKLLTVKQTDRQTNAGHYISSLVETNIDIITATFILASWQHSVYGRLNDQRCTTVLCRAVVYWWWMLWRWSHVSCSHDGHWHGVLYADIYRNTLVDGRHDMSSPCTYWIGFCLRP